MTSTNFEFLKEDWPELAGLGALAESYAHTDPTSSVFNLRLLAENLVKDIYRDLKLPKPVRAKQIDLLEGGSFCTITPKVVRDKLHAIRVQGNKAVHGEGASTATAIWLLREAFDLSRWLTVYFKKSDIQSLPKFSKPLPPADASKAKAETKKVLDRLAAQEAEMASLLEELDVARLQVETSEKKAAELEILAKSATETADVLKFDEATTRTRIIDSMIAAAGWDIAGGDASTSEVAKEFGVLGQPTSSGKGFVDYVLFDSDGSPLAVIEAKKTAADPERGRKQAQLYADALEEQSGQRPVIFYTNGYDLWLWDDAGGYPPRKVHGYYSKDSLQYLVKFQRKNKKDLSTLVPQERIVNRLYQIEAIKAVAERFSDHYRKALVVQATGTGKTRVAIALAELLIRAGWAKRVLFLCDRKELRKQAKNSFTEFLETEPVRIVNSRASGESTERIFIATYPAMLKVFQSFDVGFFDLIIADESHRSIYNIYGDLFHYFDSLQIGLTATPVSFVTRSTFGLFNCEGQLPTFNYDLEQAVTSEPPYLTPFEVFEHTTQFLRDGIRLEGLTAEQIAELEDQGEDPSNYDFSSEQIDQSIFNRDTNRVIIRNLMENGVRDGSEQSIGKTIIFARNHVHAMLMSSLFDEMYPQYGGKFCRVIDNYDPRAEQLIDDFKSSTNELTIAISVDMLDTGIDVPEIVNLVFAKPVKSPVKFWQMVGRGTRLCPDLFGPGLDKKVFRIFDHWGNFQRFEDGYQPAEPQPSKSLLQVLFEQRLTLAETALRKSEIANFEDIVALISADIEALPEESIAVRERWKEKRSVGALDNLRKFEPNTVAALRNTIAPLMQWRNIRGATEAHAFDLLVCRIQIATLMASADVADLRIDFMERLDRLQMNLNPVREKAEVIKRAKSDTFWENLTVASLEDVRKPLREIIHYREPGTSPGIGPKIIDVTEDEYLVQTGRRSASLHTVDMAAYKSIVEGELRKHFDTNPTLVKIRNGEPVTAEDLNAIISLVLTQNPDVGREALEEFFETTALPLDLAIRSMVGLDAEMVRDRFSTFVLSHPELTAKQTRFLGMLQNHIVKFGFITIGKLYDQPFTVVDADGPEGVFDKPDDIDQLMKIVNLFAPPSRSGDSDGTDKGTMH